MNQSTVLVRLKELHREIEVDAGKDPALVRDEVQPVDGLGGFDSPLIPTVVRALAKAMGIALPKGARLRNPYLDGNGNRLPLNGVAKRFCELYGKETAR